ncbi:hypothetical protein NA57DRAFT_50296 [Rhizodiscina lignyota]|uniref:Glycoside hydrolase family 92 protein n=1 Tax=Rhizodiscina lignyota TaxID=1504668 RepID=A0A9P4M2M8_9PEZI|nr:hypothetical protein NA57DRAFT_50296 [Rhizodiscina lignyota]
MLFFFTSCAFAALSFLDFAASHPSPSSSGYYSNAGVLQYVNPRIGTFGYSPNGNGGMIPSVSPPFGMTRWTPQTRENYISQCPYHDADTYMHGFQATHQPAIWMGESGQVVLSPGFGGVRPLFEQRGMSFSKSSETSTPYVYEVTLNADSRSSSSGKSIQVAQTATSHVGYLRLDYSKSSEAPYVFIQATRQNWTGQVNVDPEKREISGYNPQRQDYKLGPLHAPNFKGYFVSRFSEPFEGYGIAKGGDLSHGVKSGEGTHLGAYATFKSGMKRVEVRTGVSFVSIDQARKNLDLEIADGTSFETTVDQLKSDWLSILGRITIEGVNQTSAAHDQRTIFYTGLFHALQYPNDYSEPTSNGGGIRTFYSGYTDSVHTAQDTYHQSWSIWDTYRATHSLLTIFAPARVNGMLRSLIRIYEWSGRLPMWANIVETNIMIGTHVDAVFANALKRGFRDFDIAKAWEGVHKNAYIPPEHDTELLYYDREPYTPDEVRAGLTTYMSKGWVANDRWAESGSRTLDYAFDDYAAAVVAQHAGQNDFVDELFARSKNYKHVWNSNTTFMEARNENGTWAGTAQGWTEGDDWVYTFAVMHDVNGLAELFGGRDKLKAKLDEHFNGGHNDQTNEPSHHVPYLYAAIGYPANTQNLTRLIAWENYNATSAGLSGNEDLGQMSAWYVFSALGFYPVNPASDEYIVGSPFFEKVTIRLPAGVANGGNAQKDGERTLVISAPGAPTKPFVKSLKVNGKDITSPMLRHAQIVGASSIEFEMSETPQIWGSDGV